VATSEGKIKDLIKRRMKEEFPDAYRFCPVQNGMGAPSVDFLYCVPCGIWVAIEAKAPGKEPTPRQQETLNEMAAAGGATYVVDGVASLEEAITDIQDIQSWHIKSWQ
jgi:hypothetical protein